MLMTPTRGIEDRRCRAVAHRVTPTSRFKEAQPETSPDTKTLFPQRLHAARKIQVHGVAPVFFVQPGHNIKTHQYMEIYPADIAHCQDDQLSLFTLLKFKRLPIVTFVSNADVLNYVLSMLTLYT
jgi:hypothetical protein